MAMETLHPEHFPSSCGGSNQWYTQLTEEVLQGLQNEIDTDQGLPELKIKLCEDLDLGPATIAEAFSDKAELIHVFDLLLHETGSVYRTLSKLVEYTMDIIKDIPDELKEKMEWLRKAAIQQEIGLEGKLYGRENQLTKLLSLITSDTNVDTRLINICGMPGIGKSFLVQHLRSRLISENRIAIYVNCDGLKSLDEMLQNLLLNINVTMDNFSTAYLVGRLTDFFLKPKTDPFVVILDDITSLVDSTLKLSQLIDFFNEILINPKMREVKLKIVVTSQAHLRSKSEVEEQPAMSNVKRKVKRDWNQYTHDFPLEKLSIDDSQRFLGAALREVPDQQKLQLLNYCDGNPLALRMINELALQDFTPSTEVHQLSAADLADSIKYAMFARHKKAFNDLSDLQRHTLFAVVVFETEAPLPAIHYMVSPKESCLKFSNRIRSAFRGGFWLKFPISNMKLSKNNCEVVHVYHPRTRQFLLEMAKDREQEYLKLRRKYIFYYINQLIDIGRDCVPEQAWFAQKNPDFVRTTCGRVLHNLKNFQRVFFLLESEHPCVVFSKDGTSASVRDSSDIAYLFVALCQFHDWFDNYLVAMLQNACAAVDNVQHSVLLQTLYGMLLTVGQNWTDLELFLAPHNNLTNRNRVIDVSPGLYFLCEALHQFTAGSFYAHKSIVKVEKESLVEKRKKAFEDASRFLLRLSKYWKPVQGYFTIRTLLAMAHSVYALNTSNLNTLDEAFSLCQQAKDKCQDDHILRLTVDAKMAHYKTAQGGAFFKLSGSGDTEATKRAYEEADCYFKSVCDQFKRRGMHKGLEAAQNYSKYADMIRSYGYIRATNTKSASTTNMFKAAEVMGKNCIAILELHSFTSTNDLLTAYIHMGMCYRNLCKHHHQIPAGHTAEDSDLLREYQNKALKYYGLAYGLLLDDYRKCHLKPDDWRLDKLRNQLKHFMNLARREYHAVDKVKKNLDLIQDEVRKGAHELYLSGSEVYATSSDDYDSFSSDDMESEEVDDFSQSKLNPTTSANHPLEPDEQAANQLHALDLSRQGKKRKLAN